MNDYSRNDGVRRGTPAVDAERPAGKRTLTEGLPLRRRADRDADGVRPDAGDAVQRAAASTGAPLAPAVRGRFESSLGVDLEAVRVHTCSASAEAAEAVGAKAYTVGQDIHFARGQHAPDDPFGMHLLAHEVAHTQQPGAALRRKGTAVTAPDDPAEREADLLADFMVRGAPAPTATTARAELAREVDPVLAELGIGKEIPEDGAPAAGSGSFGSKYREPGKHYDSARANEGQVVQVPNGGTDPNTHGVQQATMRPASEANRNGHSGTPMDPEHQITVSDLVYIMQPPGQPLSADLVVTESASVSSVNDAFRLMGIDTLEAQATYLAHACVESKGFRAMSAEADPASVGEFKGRGPLQVTFQENYERTLAYLDLQAERLEAAGKTEDAAQLQEASRAIKADPKAAADRRYAFIFSAAHMHASGGVEKVESLKGRQPVFNGNGDEDSWEAGSAADFAGHIATAKANGNAAEVQQYEGYQRAGLMKKGAYARAIERLSPFVRPATPPPP